ncbi:MAG: dihydrofolate reductase [Breznakibacter sp.]
MIVSLIAVVDANMGIGYRGDQLIYIPEDLKRFKAITTGHTIVMGRKTSEALPKGMLAKRRNIVMSRNQSEWPETMLVASSVEQVMALCQEEDEIFIIGGGEIYRAFLPVANRLYITHIHHAFDQVDTIFPEVDPHQWKAIKHYEPLTDEKSGLQFQYIDYARVK